MQGAQVWVPRGGHRWRAIEAMVAAALALASFPQLYIYSAADAVVRFASIESHIRVLTSQHAAALPPRRVCTAVSADAPAIAGALASRLRPCCKLMCV